MNTWKRLLVIKLCLTLALSPIPSLASAPADAAYWNMNRSLSGVTQKAMENRGYVATDPRTYGTLSGMSGAASTAFSSAAGAAAGVGVVTAAGVTAPAWASVVIFAVVSSVIGYGINLAINGLVNWLFRSDNKIDDTIGAAAPDPATGMVAGGAYWRTSDYVNYLYGGDPSSIGNQARYNIAVRGGQANTFSPVACVTNSSVQVTCGSIVVGLVSSGAPGTCPPGSFWVSNACTVYGFASGSSQTAETLQSAVNRLPASELSKPLNPQIVAATANKLWQQAASQPGYQGLPYPQSNPITATEAQTWQQANPQVWPTVGDFVQPRDASVPNTVALPSDTTTVSAPPKTFTTAQNPSTVNPSTQPQSNLGADPGIGAPPLEQIPTPPEILAPILGLMPNLKNFSPTTHSGICPQPSFSLFGQSYVMQAQCTLIEDNKPIIQAAMAFAWALLALSIILSA